MPGQTRQLLNLLTLAYLSLAVSPLSAQGIGIGTRDLTLDDLPQDVVATMEVRDRWFTATVEFGQTQSYLVEDVVRWLPGQTVRVAFLGGDTTLHRDIEEATKQITEAASINLDFGYSYTTGKYRSWSVDDTSYTADIRVSFDQSGYFSLVGTDSISSLIGPPDGPVGGRPGQRTLNLGGFNFFRPASWRGTVRHEFLHALAFHHQHQSPSGACDNEFRWQDDSGYQPNLDSEGRYLPDSLGRRPGIYTYLAGSPNKWDKSKVDHNLRQLSASGLSFSTFDQASVMLYRFPPLFYKTIPSPCAPIGDGQSLSAGDKAGLLFLYPREAANASALSLRRQGAFESLLRNSKLSGETRGSVAVQFDTMKMKGVS